MKKTEFYNVKIIHYLNSTEYRFYSKPLFRGREREELESIYNPTEILLTPSQIKNKEEHSKNTSIARSKASVMNISRANEWQYFVTLTFNPDSIDRYNYDDCRKALNQYLNNLTKRKSKTMYYLFLPEQHKDGAWHFHGLIGGISDTDDIGIRESERKKGKYNLITWKKGFSDIELVKDTKSVSLYIVKYITKSLIDISGKSRYIASKNCSRGIEEVTFVKNQDLFKIDMIQQATYCRTVYNEHTDSTITYIQIDND